MMMSESIKLIYPFGVESFYKKETADYIRERDKVKMVIMYKKTLDVSRVVEHFKRPRSTINKILKERVKGYLD